jgi:pimeloyl-ACP methyl ester carboxylesterase
MPQRRQWRWIAVGAMVFAIGGVFLAYARDMEALRARLAAGSKIIETRHGAVEIARRGDGPAMLALHGAGGGYDQGLLLASALGGDGFGRIAPSRFGYLRSTMPQDPSTEAQADALAEMLDALGVERVSILAMSGGVPPALQFALRHPDRVSALVLLSSAPFTPFTAKEQDLPVPIWLYQALFSSDLPYWLLARSARPVLQSIFDAKPERRADMTPEEEAFVAAMVDGFLPVTARIAGVGNEGAAIDPATRYEIERIGAPTLVIHARDDGINPFAIGDAIAGRIPEAELLALPAGGHLLLGHHAAVRAKVSAFLRDHATNGKEN